MSKNSKTERKCEQCKAPMNPIDYIMGQVCLKCCKKNHRKAIGERK